VALPTVALALSAGAVAWVTRRLNAPLAALSAAAQRWRDGDPDSRLDEVHAVDEVREVNVGFNRMARALSAIEQDRAVMLAGISHDLRTPLARLRLEAELSVRDPQALQAMAADIEVLDRLIDKFTDYARPGPRAWEVIALHGVVERAQELVCGSGPGGEDRLHLTLDMPPSLAVWGDRTDLLRVMHNLLENAARYASPPGGGPARVEVQARRVGAWIDLTVRDHGPGVPEAQLPRLTTAFFRGNGARTGVAGAGLGLAIVDQAVHRMGGSLKLRTAAGGGLLAHLRLPAGDETAAAGLSDADRSRREGRRRTG
jgi:two-component system osmolarity sensor histidine kinase EnvZ